MSTFLNVCNDGEELEDISEDIFDRVNIRYTEEYDSYVSRVNQLISPEESILSVGGEHNYNRIITWTNIYNMNSYINEMEAAQIRAAVNKDTFGIAQCLNDGMMFWNFLKTSESFKSSAWYYREYMLQKLLGSVVHIEEIFYAKILEDMYNKVDINVESSVQIPWKNSTGWINNINKEDMDVISNYFNVGGDKGKLSKRMYNWFRRKFHTYEILLLSLFPNEPIARSQLMQHKVSKANQYKRQKKNNRQTIENLRVSNTQNSQIPSNNKRQKLTTFVPPINGNNTELEDANEPESIVTEIANLPITHKVNNRILHIHIDTEQFQTLIQQYPDDIRGHIMNFLKNAHNIWG